jgi:hypothetical protein
VVSTLCLFYRGLGRVDLPLRLGRFLEPAVRRAVASTADEAVKKSGREILATFH